MAEILRVGLAGAGMISRHHLIAWSRVAHASVVAIADPARERAVERAGTFGIPAVYDDPAEMLEREALAAIDIASPRETHVAIARHAIARGAAILCQKPLAPTLGEGRDLVRAAASVRLMVHENWRFRPYYRQVKRWLEDGCVGTVRQARLAFLSSGLLPGPDGRAPALVHQPFIADEERLLIAETLIHHLDVVRWLFGPLQVVACRACNTVHTVLGETMATILLETRHGAPVVVEGNAAAPGYPARATDRLELIGDVGSITLEGSRLMLQAAEERLGTTLEFDLDLAYQASFDGAIAHFANALWDQQPFETDGADNLATLELVDAAYDLAAHATSVRKN